MKTKITLERARQEFINKGYIPLFEIFNSAHEKVLAETIEGYKIEISYTKLKQGDIPSIFGNNNQYTIQNIKVWCKLNNKLFELISDEYKEAHQLLRWQCIKDNCGKIFETHWNSIYNGFHCPYCKLSYEIPSKEILEQYINNSFSLYRISKELNIPKTSLARFFKKYDLKTKQAIKNKNYMFDKTGMKFGKLIVVRYDHTGKDNYKYYLCKCDCGNEKILSSQHLTHRTKSCGCMVGGWHWKNSIKNEQALSHIGEIINGVKIIDIIHVKTNVYKMVCKCYCGNIFETSYWGLKHGKTRSCGCYAKECSSITGSNQGANFYKNKYQWYFVKNGEKVRCRSGFEVIYANWLINNNINFEYERKCFKLGNGRRYTPDFYLVNENKYIETKGSFRMNDNRQFDNIQLFQEEYDLDILYWNDLINICDLQFKYYSQYLNKAKKLNIPYEEFLGQQYYLKEVV